jgi:hypothetical protein
MATLEAPAQSAAKARDAAEAAVPAGNPAHAAFAAAIADQNAYQTAVRDILSKRNAQATAAGALAATKDPSSTRSKRLQAFVVLVDKNKLKPITQYAKDNWPGKPEEFYAEAFSLWHTDPTFLGSYSAALKSWFDAGEHLK